MRVPVPRRAATRQLRARSGSERVGALRGAGTRMGSALPRIPPLGPRGEDCERLASARAALQALLGPRPSLREGARPPARVPGRSPASGGRYRGAPMSSPAPHVVPIFATPFGVVTVPEAQALNPVLAAQFLERASRDRKSVV